jgi:hypothetical protein
MSANDLTGTDSGRQTMMEDGYRDSALVPPQPASERADKEQAVAAARAALGEAAWAAAFAAGQSLTLEQAIAEALGAAS